MCQKSARGARRTSPQTWLFGDPMNIGIEREPEVSSDRAVETLNNPLPDQIIPARFRPWPERGYDLLRHIRIGALLGGIAGCTSLMINVIGSVAWTTAGELEQHPLRIIQVYLTFPFGESAL